MKKFLLFNVLASLQIGLLGSPIWAKQQTDSVIQSESVRKNRPWVVSVGWGLPKAYGLSLVYNPLPAWAIVGNLGLPKDKDANLSLSGRYYFGEQPVSFYLESGFTTTMGKVEVFSRSSLFDSLEGFVLFGLEYRDPGGLCFNLAFGESLRQPINGEDHSLALGMAVDASLGYAY